MDNPTETPQRFKTEMPRIPGVNDSAENTRSTAAPLRLLLLAAAVAAVLGGVTWRTLRGSRARPHSSQVAAGTELPATPFIAAATEPRVSALPAAPGIIGTVDEFAKPWSSKKFTFAGARSASPEPAMVVRLPGVAETRNDAYWAFSLNVPFEQCNLDLITDLKVIASRYAYPAAHPMVAASCDGTLYDPLKLGTAPSGAWVRGEIVQGAGIRPPLAVEIRVEGRNVIADKIE